MASSAPSDAADDGSHPATGGNSSSALPGSTDFGQDVLASLDNIAQPVELRDLPGGSGGGAPATDTQQNPQDQARQPAAVAPAASSTAAEAEEGSIQQTQDSAIGPATEQSPASQHAGAAAAARQSIGGRQLVITLLMHSTETRHPYVIDESYLRRRNVSLPDGDPVNMSVYTLKELILRDWRSEWDNKPTSPTSIRLIHWGRLLEDKAYLKDCRFVSGDVTHVVHMTIKPQEIIDEEDARMAKGGRVDRDGNERTPTCRCPIM